MYAHLKIPLIKTIFQKQKLIHIAIFTSEHGAISSDSKVNHHDFNHTNVWIVSTINIGGINIDLDHPISTSKYQDLHVKAFSVHIKSNF